MPKRTDHPTTQPTPALQPNTVATEPATVAACAQDYAQGAAARAGLTRTAQRQYPNR